MGTLTFTQQLRRFTDAPELETSALRLDQALAQAFERTPRLRGYVLDDQGHLRANVVIFIDGRRVMDRRLLHDPLQPDSRVYVLQALSGG